MDESRPAGQTKEQEGTGSGSRDKYSGKNLSTLPSCVGTGGQEGQGAAGTECDKGQKE